jgi:pyridoxamine 5'-phosphate oxidase
MRKPTPTSLEQRVAALEAEYQDKPIPRPSHWTGLRIIPTRIEFWCAGDHRLHDRFEFTRSSKEEPWKIQRLNP